MQRADEGLAFLLRYENVAWYEDGKVRILDRRIYPVRTEYVTCTRHEEVAQAIADMVTQSGGPYTAAAMGMALAAYEARALEEDAYLAYMKKAAYTLSHARPTTVEKMKRVVERALGRLERELKNGTPLSGMPEKLKEDAVDSLNANYSRYDRLAMHLADKIPNGGTVMTQCFAETIIGTLLRECRKRGNEIKMICPETRPYYQGARLTASVACDMGFDTTVITDNMPAYTMKMKNVDIFTSAADVITMDGYVVNKVGTFQIAMAARYWGIPYFTTGTPNAAHPNIDSVKIELRDPALVTESMGLKHTMEGVRGYYPAFDVTPPKLVDGIVTEKGILSPFNLKAYFELPDHTASELPC
ncbi:MAG: s-methyl-5-thioribose-1-phosphate isomerase [Subdoligranulum sp.]|nr:s-methyl-5-thioribose-1-phosphate isomerase [Subdoligranulum sp.]